MNLTSKDVPTVLEKPIQRIRTSARILVSRFFAVGVAAALILGRSRWDEPGAMTPEVMMLIGLTLATLAMAGRMWCSLFIAGRKNAELVTQGPYALSRNPLYFFSLIGSIGVGLASGMFTVALALGLAFALYYPAVIRREEAYLHLQHGDQFTFYLRTVPCFWPRWRDGPDAFPESVACHGRIFVRHLASAIWFPIVCGGVHFVGRLHSHRTDWPVWLVLP